ncbi:MAG: MFS transporter [Gemmataceae bacterium]|nr:MFS transporter [Gemmataceae bacterium]
MNQPPGRLDTLSPGPGLAPLTCVRWRILALLLAFSFLSWFNRMSMPVAYDERIRHQLGISAEAIGYVYSALLFAYMLCMTPGGWFADHYGSRRALAVMGLGSALFVAATGVVGLVALSVTATVVALLAVRAALGVFTAPIYPGSGHAIARWLPARQRAAANGAVMGAAVVGIAASYYAFGTLLDLFDWPAAFLATGTVTGLLAVLWVWYATDLPVQHPGVNPSELHWIRSGDRAVPARDVGSEAIMAADPLPPPRTAPHSADSGSWRALLTNRSLVLLTLSYAAVGYIEYLFFFWMHYYFDEVLKVGKDTSRLYATILYLAMAAGMFLGGWLADRLSGSWGRRAGRTVVVVGGMLLGAALLGAGLLAPEPEWIVLCFALALAAVGATEGPFWATALELGGRRGATAAGIFNTGGNAGGVLAPVVTPLVSSAYGWLWGIGLGGLVCLAGVCLWGWIDPGAHGDETPG